MPDRRAVIAGLAVVLGWTGVAYAPAPSADDPDFDAVRAAVPDDPGDIDAWLKATEARGVKPGTERTIVWANPGFQVPMSVVYLHGFSASRKEMTPVPERVAQLLGANLYLARFEGHGLPGDALADVTASDWLADTEQALRIGEVIGEKVVVLGTSTGATLALLELGRRPNPKVEALVLVSPNFGPRNRAAGIARLPWLSAIVPPLLGNRTWEPRNPQQAAWWTTTYPTTAVRPLMAAVHAANSVPLDGLPRSLWAWSEADDVVDPALTLRAWDRLPPGLHTRWDVPPAAGQDNHVLAGDILSPGRNDEMVRRIVEFVRGP